MAGVGRTNLQHGNWRHITSVELRIEADRRRHCVFVLMKVSGERDVDGVGVGRGPATGTGRLRQ